MQALARATAAAGRHQVRRATAAWTVGGVHQRSTSALARFSASASSSSRSSFGGWLYVAAVGSSLVALGVLGHSVAQCDADLPGDSIDEQFGVTVPTIDPAVYDPPMATSPDWIEDWDGLASVPPAVDPKSGRPIHVTRHLLFIRHGQYVLPTRDTQHLDPVLTQLGREQARITGRRLASLGYPVSVIHHSTMARAHETAQLIAEAFPKAEMRPTDLIREGVPCAHHPVHPTWHPSEEDKATEPPRIQEGFRQLVKRWRSTPDGKQIHSLAEWQAAKVAPAVTTAAPLPPASDAGASGPASTSAGTISLAGGNAGNGRSLPPIQVDQYELVVCHGNVVRYSLLRALQLPVQAWLRIAIYNTGISHIYVRSNGHVGMQTLGDTGHLAREQITYH